MLNLTQLISDYGYPVLAIGCLLEGETVLVLASFAAHRGLLAWPAVLGIAIVFSFAGDQFWYFVGHRYGIQLLARFAGLRDRLLSVRSHVTAHPVAWVLGIRFMFGLRTIGPIILGCQLIAPKRFLALNFLGAILWATSFTAGGYFFGQLLETLLPNLKAIEEKVMLGLLLLGMLIHLWKTLRRKRHEP